MPPMVGFAMRAGTTRTRHRSRAPIATLVSVKIDQPVIARINQSLKILLRRWGESSCRGLRITSATQFLSRKVRYPCKRQKRSKRRYSWSRAAAVDGLSSRKLTCTSKLSYLTQSRRSTDSLTANLGLKRAALTMKAARKLARWSFQSGLIVLWKSPPLLTSRLPGSRPFQACNRPR